MVDVTSDQVLLRSHVFYTSQHTNERFEDHS